MASANISTEQAQSILDVSRILAVTTELDPLLQQVAEAAASLLHCERTSIFVHDPRTGELWTKVALQRSEIRIPANIGIAGHAFTSNQISTIRRSSPCVA
jgi:adenylate cyclase